MTLIPPAKAAQELSNVDVLSTQQAHDITITNAINTAVAAGAKTCTYSTSGITSSDVQLEQLFLQEQGYTYSTSGTTVTVSWL